MMESGRVVSEMAMVCRNGQMVPFMKVNGKIIELTDKENSLISTVTYTRASGSTTKQTAMVSITTSMVLAMRATGEKISNMVTARRAGLMDQYMRVSI